MKTLHKYLLYTLLISLIGCTPLAGTGSFFFLCTLGVLFIATTAVRAGPPMPSKQCNPKTEATHTFCKNGKIQKQCYPKNARINFAYQPYQNCGYGNCVKGNDPSLCGVPQPRIDSSQTKKTCAKQNWQKVCLDNKVKEACIRQPPTNYTGPPANPHFTTCKTQLGQRCSTLASPETCYPKITEMKEKACQNNSAWQKAKICISTHISERCLPKSKADGSPWTVTPFIDCGKERCTTARSKSSCPR